MTYEQVRQQMLFQHHKNIQFWYITVGKLFEATKGFTASGYISLELDSYKYTLSFDADTSEWNFERDMPKKKQMAAGRIKFIRKYLYSPNAHEYWYDIVYHSGRISTRSESDLPDSARKYIMGATRQVSQYDRVYHREELIFSME